ncbi:MAG: biopolymer transporter ExbD [Phycisphaerales bacterium]|nr:biopolymer transporter ExbD [Phycisphaerales bacterium]
MRRRPSQLASPAGSEPINVTPLIDVVMCLIIFFLIVGKLAANEKGRVRLPGTTIGQVAERQDAVVVSIARPDGPGARGQVTVDGQTARDGPDLVRLLSTRLEAQARITARQSRGDAQPISRGKVTIRADKDLPYESVEPVLTACSQLGLTRVDYATARTDLTPAGGRTP